MSLYVARLFIPIFFSSKLIEENPNEMLMFLMIGESLYRILLRLFCETLSTAVTQYKFPYLRKRRWRCVVAREGEACSTHECNTKSMCFYLYTIFTKAYVNQVAINVSSYARARANVASRLAS